MPFGEIASGARIRKEATIFSAILLCLTSLSMLSLAWQIAFPEPIRFAGITIDRLSAALTLLVAVIGIVTLRYSINYLDGNPWQLRFLRLLTITVVSAYLLMCSTNLILLFAFWALTSLGLHELLTIYRDRHEALRPARKKFFISRLGDAALIAAIFLIWRDWHTLDLHRFLEEVAGTNTTRTTGWIAFLIAVAALTKSAQFPFHTWLPETMESPTPVSALMHTGIINAGGVLLIRFAPLIARVPEVLLLLSIVGTITFTLGMLSMWAQVKVKRSLAWSTVSQMGFMMVQCGLGAFPAAALHMIGHGCYKAWSFLHSSEVPAPSGPAVSPVRALILGLVGTLFAIPALILAARLTGYSPLHSPGEFALSAIVAISVGQLWIAMLGKPTAKFKATITAVLSAMMATIVSTAVAFSLYQAAAIFLQPVLGELPPSVGILGWISALLPVISLLSLAVLQSLLPVIGKSAMGRSFHVHALNGFYFGALADRLVDSLKWRSNTIKSGVNHA